MTIVLRDLDDSELDLLFEWEQHPVAIEMAAFTRADPSDRAAFDAHYERIRADPDVMLRAIDDGQGLVGTIGSFTIEGDREITYWISPERWGEGVASAALAAFLDIEHTRPLFARAADHNLGSTAVLVRAGFERIGGDTGYAAGVGREVVESIFRYTRT
ncbi:MAG: putative acetyltransferase [Microbacteriaceae bacterium]|jgi:RimJ/RimL family protein N-acetyltransferase|nr:putative acetyltransferase [Microbacteriaceae bacterium]